MLRFPFRLPVRVSSGPKAFESRHDHYFIQTVEVGGECDGFSRLQVFENICRGRRVLHVGCSDWPITDPKSNLHVQLDPICAVLDGFDVNVDAFSALAPLVNGRLFSDWADVNGEYDIVLAPEVLEHVGNVQGFLGQLDAVKARHIVLTVPDAYQCSRLHFEYRREQRQFLEAVHPDHNCWFTPYTFVNVISKYTSWAVQGVWLFNNISLLGVFSKGDLPDGDQVSVI